MRGTPIGTAADEIEKQLAEAQQDKALAQVPAIRRLNYVTRVFFVLGILGLFITVPLVVGILGAFGADVANPVDAIAYFAYAIALYLGLAINVLLLIAYWRFGRQLRRNEVKQLSDTTSMVGRIWGWSVGVGIAGIIAMILLKRTQFPEVIISQVLGLITPVVLFFVMRHYVRTALAELPELIARAAPGIPTGDYRSWRQIFLIALGATAPVIAIGFLVSS